MKLVTNGPEAQNENKHSSPDKIGCLQVPQLEDAQEAPTSFEEGNQGMIDELK